MMYFCTVFECRWVQASFLQSPNAQMAELVDALVSNTSAARHAGSIPALGTQVALKVDGFQGDLFFQEANKG